MEPRLASSVLVGALLRQAEAQGGFGMVLAKGEPNSGAVALVLAERGGAQRYFERMLQSDGSYQWQEPRKTFENDSQLSEFLARRRKIDPDLWVVELTIASAERFAAEMNGLN